MTKSIRRHALALAGVAALFTSGCSLVETGFDALSFANLAATTRQGFDTATGTPTMPKSGSATYDGFAAAFVRDSALSPTGRSLIGDAELSANFSATGGTVNGTVDDIIASEGLDETDIAAILLSGTPTASAIWRVIRSFDSTTGEIRIENGVIGGTNPEDFVADLSGTVNHNGTRITFGGSGEGSFHGDNAQYVSFEGDTSDGMTIRQNGRTKSGDFMLLGVE